MELISVIAPAHNVAKYLEECIEGILNQTYNNIELLLVENGSTDLSGVICDEYAGHPQIRVFHVKESRIGILGSCCGDS